TPVPRLSAAAKGKQPAKAKSSSDLSKVAKTKAEQLKIVLRRSRQEMHISQHGGSSADEGTGSKPGVPDAQDEGDKNDESDDGNDDETVKEGYEIDDDDDDDDNDDEEELAKISESEDRESDKGDDEATESDREREDEETREQEEESFDPIPRTPEDNEDDGNGHEDQGLRISEEERMQEEEEADELYRDVNINQGRGLQVSQSIEDPHVTLTPVHPDGLQESSLMSSFVTSMLNPISDAGVESIFTTASFPIVSLQTPTPIMNPSTIATITTSSDPPIPPTTIPSTILKNLPIFNSVFHFDERLRSLETTFSEYRQTNPFVNAV
nr:hypothetical protein [Tanacetum cinerariifolium]